MHLHSILSPVILLAISTNALPIAQRKSYHLRCKTNQADRLLITADDVVAALAIDDESKSWAGPLTDFEDSFPRDKRQCKSNNHRRVWN